MACALRRNHGLRISESHKLDTTNLKLEQECKSNSRLLIYGVLSKMSKNSDQK